MTNDLLNTPSSPLPPPQKRIVLTNHARERAQECQIEPERLPELLSKARREKNSFRREVYKAATYGAEEADTAFFFAPVPWWTNKGLLFTCSDKGDSIVVITVTSKKRKGLRLR
jgi:hypothetical protein